MLPEGITMRAALRRAVTLVVVTAALASGAATVSSAPAPALAEPVCLAGTNWDGILKICR
jgi:hypothetical protein